jgi:hypothetical protein
MNQLGEAIPAGEYVLNGAMHVSIEVENKKRCINMGQPRRIEITASVKEGVGWKIWYVLDKSERVGTVVKAPKV